MWVTIVSVAVMLALAVISWPFEAMGVFGADMNFFLVLMVGCGGIICAIERNGKDR